MNYLRICLIWFVMASIGLNAGSPKQIEKDSPALKELNLSVTHKDSPQDQNKVMITVTFKGDKHSQVNLINSGKNEVIKTDFKDGMVSMSFEIEKTSLEKSSLMFSSNDALTRCKPGFLLYLKGFVD